MQINSDLSCRLKRFDVVEVINQPNNQQLAEAIHIIVEEPQEGYAKISQLTIEGYVLVPLQFVHIDCLKLCKKPVWRAAGQVFRQHILESEIEKEKKLISQKNKLKRKSNAIKLLAKKFKLNEDDVKFIYKTIREA